MRPGGAIRIASAGGAPPLVRLASNAPLPLRCAAAGALCNLLAACPAALQVVHIQQSLLLDCCIRLAYLVTPQGQTG